jgi:hypothetical protein
MWFGISGLLALLGDWWRLSKLFPDPDPPQAPLFGYPSGISMNSMNYRSCVTAVADEDGIHLRISLIFRFMHPPLLIPWSAIGSITQKKILFFTQYEAVVEPTGTKITFGRRTGKAVFEQWQQYTASRDLAQK